MNKYGVVIFHTTSAVMRAEKVLMNDESLNIKLIPTPREISSDCGIALRFNWDKEQDIRRILDEANIEMAGIYPVE